MDGERYRHTQYGTTIIVAGIGVLAMSTVIAIVGGTSVVLYFALPTAAVMLALFGSLTVWVDDTHVRLTFGVGLIRKAFALDRIRGAALVRNPWWVGSGIRLIDGGWLYCVDGRMAVDLRMEDGSRVAIGSDEPAALLAAITEAAALPGDAPSAAEDDATVRWSLVALAVFFIAMGAMGYMQMRPARVEITREAVTIRSGFYKTVIPMRQITEVVIADSAPVIEARTNGFALGSSRRGRFRVQGLGTGMLYLEKDSPPYVVIKTTSTFAILSYKDEAHTSQLIEGLAKASAP